MTEALQKFIPYLALALIYLAVASNFRANAQPLPNKPGASLRSGLLALGLIIHASLLYQVTFAHGLNLGFFNVVSLITWLTVLIYGWADRKHNLAGLQAFILPQAALFAVLPAFMVANHTYPNGESALFLAHIAIALLAYSLFTFATLHALLMLFAERSLHNKSSVLRLPSFPPLMVMESLLFQIIRLGFILLSITLLSGMLFSEEIFAQPLQFNHKSVFSIASWFIYAALLFGRVRYGWRGMKAIRWTVAGFALLLLAYLGSKFILQVLLGR